MTAAARALAPGLVLQRVDHWFLPVAPARRLAMFRVLTGSFTVVYLLVRLPVLLSMGGADPGFEPVGVLWWIGSPLSDGVVRALVIGTVVLAVLYTIGGAFRLLGPLFALALLVVTTYRSSGGQLLWFDNLLVLHVLIVGCSAAADALVVRRAGPPPDDDVRYGWPLRLAGVVTVITYVLAGVAKLRIGGAGWLDGESLRNHVAYSAARLRVLGGTPSPLAAPLLGQAWLFVPLALATLVIELGAPVALFVRRIRTPWVLAMWGLHAGIAATMFVVFPYPLAGIAFAPLFRLERLGRVTDALHPRR